MKPRTMLCLCSRCFAGAGPSQTNRAAKVPEGLLCIGVDAMPWTLAAFGVELFREFLISDLQVASRTSEACRDTADGQNPALPIIRNIP